MEQACKVYGVAFELVVLNAVIMEEPGATWDFVLVESNTYCERRCFREHEVWSGENARVSLM